ncbi:hypothetical protein ACLB2K_003732 [Fragaria x ananassa]
MTTSDADQEPKQLHVLLVVILQAHINPMLRFARCLASKRVHVTLAATETVRNHLLHRTNLSTAPTKHSMIEFEFFSDGLTAEFDRDKSAETFAALQAVSAKNLSILINNFSTKKSKLSCIVFNPFAPWVADVAAEHGIPCALLWNQACSIFSINYRYYKNLLNPFEFMECPGIPNLQVSDLPSTILPSTPVHFKKLISDSARCAEKASWVLGNSFYELEREIIDSMESLVPIRPIGPLVSPFLLGKSDADDESSVDVWEAEESCIEWLDKQRPCSVIFVSFGRVTVLSQKQIDNISTALKNSGRPFLWSLKLPAEGSTRDSGELSREFLEETKEKGMVVTWCSQSCKDHHILIRYTLRIDKDCVIENQHAKNGYIYLYGYRKKLDSFFSPPTHPTTHAKPISHLLNPTTANLLSHFTAPKMTSSSSLIPTPRSASPSSSPLHPHPLSPPPQPVAMNTTMTASAHRRPRCRFWAIIKNSMTKSPGREKVLKHKAVACFMTHGGWNSSLETVISGVPVIVYPEWTDQPTNAKLLSDVFKVGVRVRINGDEEDGVVSTDEVERCIEEVTEGPRASEMKKRAMELKEAANKALEVGGSSDQNIDKFIEDISTRSVCNTKQ